MTEVIGQIPKDGITYQRLAGFNKHRKFADKSMHAMLNEFKDLFDFVDKARPYFPVDGDRLASAKKYKEDLEVEKFKLEHHVIGTALKTFFSQFVYVHAGQEVEDALRDKLDRAQDVVDHLMGECVLQAGVVGSDKLWWTHALYYNRIGTAFRIMYDAVLKSTPAHVYRTRAPNNSWQYHGQLVRLSRADIEDSLVSWHVPAYSIEKRRRQRDRSLLFGEPAADDGATTLNRVEFGALPLETAGVPSSPSDKIFTGDCVVCFLPLYPEPASTAVSLPCGHRFHEGCARYWLSGQKPSCPECSKDVRDF